MIAVENVLVSDDVIEAEFVCDLERCKGGCCVDGDCGAPLTAEEKDLLPALYPHVRPYLPPAHIAEIERQGYATTDDEFGHVTPTINGGICVYGYTDETGIVKCGIEKAWQEGLIAFQKPISCHLYPIRILESDGFEAVNYEPRKVLCRPACKLGKKLRVPVYQFLKTPLIRKYGEEFWRALDAAAKRGVS